MESLENEQSSFSKLSITSPTTQLILILQFFLHFTYITAHSPTLPSLYLHHNSLSNTSVASPTSQLILQPFFRLSYITGFSLRSPGEPPMSGFRGTDFENRCYNAIHTVSCFGSFSEDNCAHPYGNVCELSRVRAVLLFNNVTHVSLNDATT